MGTSSLPPELLGQLVSTLGVKLETMTDIELALKQLSEALNQQCADKILDDLEPEDGSPKPCPRCGK